VAGSISQKDLRALVLGLLARREMYGYEIAAALAAQLRASDGAETETIELAEGSVYPALRRLERDGLLSARWVEIGEGAPRRRYYVLTPAGERQAARTVAHAPTPASAIARCQGARP
jgi:DNA-binding PadR family transcriptional regulator